MTFKFKQDIYITRTSNHSIHTVDIIPHYSSETFKYRPSIWFISPLLFLLNFLPYLTRTRQEQGMTAEFVDKSLAVPFRLMNHVSLIVFLFSAIICVYLWHLYSKSSKFIKLTENAISAPKHFATRHMTKVMFSDIISIRESSLSGNLIIKHQTGQLVINGSGFGDSRIKNNIYRDIRNRVKQHLDRQI